MKTPKDEIRELMRSEGIWEYMMNMKPYTTEELLAELGDIVSPRLADLLKNHTSGLQKYLDSRIVVPIQ